MGTIDREMKTLLSFQRLPVDMYQKLQWLRDEEKSGKTVNFTRKK